MDKTCTLRRRWCIRIAAVTLSAAFVAYVYFCREQVGLADAIRRSRGHVIYSYQIEMQFDNWTGFVLKEDFDKVPFPEWLNSIVGVDAFHNIVMVTVDKSFLTDDNIRRLARVGSLQRLGVTGDVAEDELFQLRKSLPKCNVQLAARDWE